MPTWTFVDRSYASKNSYTKEDIEKLFKSINTVEKAEKLINKYSQVNVSYKQFEQIQVVRYKPTQEYKEHFDICHPFQAYEDQLKTCKEEFKKFNSVRYATIIFYLNDGFNGGETYFPNINKKIIIMNKEAHEPIEDALYATGNFTTGECEQLTEGIIRYILDAGYVIVKQ